MAKKVNVKIGVNMAKKPSAQKVGEARVDVKPKIGGGHKGGLLTQKIIEVIIEAENKDEQKNS